MSRRRSPDRIVNIPREAGEGWDMVPDSLLTGGGGKAALLIDGKSA